MIYFDMDGVLADFEQGFERSFGGRQYNESTDAQIDEFWSSDVWKLKFFESLPTIEPGLQMLDSVCRSVPMSDICILTSTGGGNLHGEICRQKLSWIADNGLGDLQVAFCKRTVGKVQFASPLDILIDDRDVVLEAWMRCGGFGLKFNREDIRPGVKTALREYPKLQRAKGTTLSARLLGEV